MSSKDKTRNKLVGSMRKTKAAAGIGDDQTESSRTSPTPTTAEPARKPAARPSKAASPARRAAPNPDNYQSGRRVWPD